MDLIDIGKIALSLSIIIAMLSAGIKIPCFFWDREPIKPKMIALTSH
jgi:hypothetical protein